MSTITFPLFKAAWDLKAGKTTSLLEMAKATGIPQPTLWRWEKNGIPHRKSSIKLVSSLVEQHGLVLRPE